jgi:hypothetical protein
LDCGFSVTPDELALYVRKSGEEEEWLQLPLREAKTEDISPSFLGPSALVVVAEVAVCEGADP